MLNQCHSGFILLSLSTASYLVLAVNFHSLFKWFKDAPVVHFLRMTLAEKFPCLRFLSPTPRKECISSSISESSFRDSIISRQSTASRTHFISASPNSTDMVILCFTLMLLRKMADIHHHRSKGVGRIKFLESISICMLECRSE